MSCISGWNCDSSILNKLFHKCLQQHHSAFRQSKRRQKLSYVQIPTNTERRRPERISDLRSRCSSRRLRSRVYIARITMMSPEKPNFDESQAFTVVATISDVSCAPIRGLHIPGPTCCRSYWWQQWAHNNWSDSARRSVDDCPSSGARAAYNDARTRDIARTNAASITLSGPKLCEISLELSDERPKCRTVWPEREFAECRCICLPWFLLDSLAIVRPLSTFRLTVRVAFRDWNCALSRQLRCRKKM